MGSIGSSMSRSGRTTAASGAGPRPAIWPSCAKSPSTSWGGTDPPGSACGPVASRPPGMTSTCSLFWPADFMRRPCLKEDEDGRSTIIRVQRLHQVVAALADKPTLILDATLPDLSIIRPFYPAVELTADIKASLPHVQVRYVLDAPT